MRQPGRAIRSLALLAVVGLAAAACGGGGSGGSGSSSGSSGGGSGKTVVVGTTDKVISLDPAGAYDLGSWTIMYNVYQNLLKIKPGTAQFVPDAADCKFDNPTSYTCTLKPGMKFSNGDPVTAQDVVFSFTRVGKINDPNGPVTLLASMKSVTAKDDKTVNFALNAPDQTWPFVLTTGAGAIVDQKVFPPNKLLADEKIIGSGPYAMKSFKKDQQAVFTVNKNYKGDDKLANNGVILQYQQQSSSLKLAVEQGDADVAYRSLSPTDVKSLKGESSKGVKVVQGAGTEIRYLVFNTKLAPGKDKAVRRAVAYTLDRQSIVDNVYNGTVQALYSMVPVGLAGHTEAYKDVFGAKPDVAKAKAELTGAGVKTPVNIQVWWTPSHYGPNSGDEYTEVKRSLEASGLFKIQLKSAEYDVYSKASKTDQYPAYQLGWFPDFPDADDYLAPFYLKGGFFNNHYDNPTIDKMIAQEKAESDKTKRNAIIGQIQQLAAQDVPTLPVWQGNQVAATRDTISGVDKTFDPSFTFRFWLINKK